MSPPQRLAGDCRDEPSPPRWFLAKIGAKSIDRFCNKIYCSCQQQYPPGVVRKIDLSNFQVATSETARHINRRIVLNLIRKHQPISRADLSRHSGLQRSTVSVIAEELIKDRWITEGANGHTPRGRRPRFLHLNKERVGKIGRASCRERVEV